MTDIGPISLGDIEPGMELKGTVKQIQLAGAIIDVGLEECDAVLHISQIRKRRVNNVRDFLEEGQDVIVWAQKVDRENARLTVTMVEPAALPWEAVAVGDVYMGKVIRIEKFGVFVDIGAERPGLVHISELAHEYISSAGEVVQKGDEIEVKVVGVNLDKRQIDLSAKAVLPTPQQEVIDTEDEKEDEPMTAMAVAMQRALEGTSSEEDTATQRKKDTQRAEAEQQEILRRSLERHKNSGNQG
nr:S1 RNA-binding domain-containing protein [Anaerolineae bacterium]